MTNSIAEIEDAACLFVIGSNTTEAASADRPRIFEAKRNGAQADRRRPRRIHLARLADLHLRPNFGTDVALINGMMHEIIIERLS